MNKRQTKPQKTKKQTSIKNVLHARLSKTNKTSNTKPSKAGSKRSLALYQIYLAVFIVSFVGLTISILSYFYSWPLKITYLFGVGSIAGAEKVASVLRLPVLLFLALLCAYSVKRTIETYRESFDKEFNKNRASRNRKKRSR